MTSKYKNKVLIVSQIAEYNFAIYFLSNALKNMNFGLILTNLEPFIGWVPERAKIIIMNMGIKIPLICMYLWYFSKIANYKV